MTTLMPNYAKVALGSLSRAKAHWRARFVPHARLSTPERRRQTRLLSALLLPLIPIAFVASIAGPLLVFPEADLFRTAEFYIGMFAALALLLAYILNRLGHYEWAAQLTICMTTAALTFVSMANLNSSYAVEILFFTPIVVLLAGMLLTVRQTAFFAVYNFASALYITWLIGGVGFRTLTSVVLALGISSLLTLIGAAIHRSDLRHIEQQAQSLMENELLYRDMLESAFEGISIHVGGALLQFNRAFAALFGYNPHELAGAHLQLVLPSGTTGEVFHRILSAEGKSFEAAGRTKSGQMVAVEIVSRTCTYQGQPASLTAWHDITARKQSEDRIRQEAVRADALLHLAARLNSQLTLETVLEAVIDAAVRFLDVPVCTISIYEPATEMLHYVADRGLPPQFRQEIQPIPRRIYSDYVRQVGSNFVTPDIQALPDGPLANAYKRYGLRSAVNISMLRAGELIGSLRVATIETTREFTEGELSLLKGIADQAAQAISNVALFAETRRRADEFRALYETARALGIRRDLPSLLETIIERASSLLAAPAGALFMLDAVSGELEVAYSKNFPRPIGTRVKRGEGMAWRVASTREPLLIEDYKAWEFRSEFFDSSTLAAVIGVPMLHRNDLLGVLSIVELGDSKRRFNQNDARLLSLFASQAASIIHNTQLFAQTERRLQQLQSLHAIDLSIASGVNMESTLQLFLRELLSQLQVDASDVLLLNPHNHQLEYAARLGFHSSAPLALQPATQEDSAARVVREHRPAHIPDLAREPGFGRQALVDAERLVWYYGVPLISRGQVKGVLEVFHRSTLAVNDEWLAFLDTLAGQAAIAIDNSELVANLQRTSGELALAYDTTLEGWSRALELRDLSTEGHTLRVTEVALQLARALGVDDGRLAHIRRGGLLHDIGKMGVPDSILLKPGALTAEEWAMMRRHPEYAYQMLSPIAYLRDALDIPYAHHEKWDGSGYPRGLKGEQIPLSARLFAVVDVWDALRTDRPYRAAWSEERVRAHIQALAGSHFDPLVVSAFLKML